MNAMDKVKNEYAVGAAVKRLKVSIAEPSEDTGTVDENIGHLIVATTKAALIHSAELGGGEDGPV